MATIQLDDGKTELLKQLLEDREISLKEILHELVLSRAVL